VIGDFEYKVSPIFQFLHARQAVVLLGNTKSAEALCL